MLSFTIELGAFAMRQMLVHEGNFMLQKATAIAVILTLSLVLVACGETGQDSSSDNAPETPKPTQAPTATPQIEPTPTQAPTATPQIEPTPTQVPTATPQIEPTSTPAPTATPLTEPASPSIDPIDIPEHLREKTTQFWEAYNKYDLDALKTFYEENYWNEQEAEVQSNMQPFKSFGMKITAEETSPPTEIAPGKWEIRQTASFSVGSIKMLFIYEEFDEDWLLTYAEAQ